MILQSCSQQVFPLFSYHPAGVLVWTDNLATQLTPDTAPATDNTHHLIGHLIPLWQSLVGCLGRAAVGPEYAAIQLKPGMLRLLQHMAMDPAPFVPAAAAGAPGWDALAPSALLDSVEMVSGMCGALLELQWRQRMWDVCVPPASAKHTASSSSRSRDGIHGPSVQQLAMMVDQEVRNSSPIGVVHVGVTCMCGIVLAAESALCTVHAHHTCGEKWAAGTINPTHGIVCKCFIERV
jgi:hypothetical protein